jgi:hypothetical protein
VKTDDPGNSGSASTPNGEIITDFVIKAGTEEFHFGQGAFDDGCYRGLVDGDTATWEKYGSGRDCKDVSHVQLWFEDNPPDDVCPNLPGIQEELPEGYRFDDEGNCVPPDEDDFCPNLEGNQATVPEGLIIDKDGNCVPPPPPPDYLDICNFTGLPAWTVGLPYYVYFVDGNGGTTNILGSGPFGFIEAKAELPVFFHQGSANGGTYLVTIGDENTPLFTFTVARGICSIVETPPPPVMSSEGDVCLETGIFGVFRGVDAVYFAVDCDPHVQIFVDGVLLFEKPDFGNERVRVPAAPESFIEIFVQGELWGYYMPNSTVFMEG